MGSLIGELRRREAAARTEAYRLRSRIEELAEDLARAEEQVARRQRAGGKRRLAVRSRSSVANKRSTRPADQNKRAPLGEILKHHAELPGNTVFCELPGPFALVSEDATDSGDVIARH
jgi:hypothetical protein